MLNEYSIDLNIKQTLYVNPSTGKVSWVYRISPIVAENAAQGCLTGAIGANDHENAASMENPFLVGLLAGLRGVKPFVFSETVKQK